MTLRLSEAEWAELDVDPLQVDDEPWPTAEPAMPVRRDVTLILLAVLAIAAIGVIAWSAQR